MFRKEGGDNLGVPRVCGGDPDIDWTDLKAVLVFPVYAGVILLDVTISRKCDGVPRVCGGDPDNGFKICHIYPCSPCMRG